jgi:hypothetical protein
MRYGTKTRIFIVKSVMQKIAYTYVATTFRYPRGVKLGTLLTTSESINKNKTVLKQQECKTKKTK